MTQKSTGEKIQHDNAATPARIVRGKGTRGMRAVFTTMLLALVAGLAASLLTVVLMGILRLAAGVATPVELFGDFVLKHISVDTFLRLLLTFGPNAKSAPLAFTLLAMICVGTLLGLLYAVLVRVQWPVPGYRPSRRELLVAALLTLCMMGVGILLFWNELRQNFLGLPIGWASLVTALSLLADFSLYGLTLCLCYRALLPKQARPGVSPVVQSRRQLLSRAGVVALTVGATGGTLGLIRGYLDSFSTYDGAITSAHNGFTAPITPNSEHYVVTQNPIDPTVITKVWRLEVTGLVGSSGSYSYEELQKLPSISRAVTLECIANATFAGGRLISTAIWQGVTLRSLLERHGGAQANATHVAFYSVDGYNVSLPLNEVLQADALLAWRMNGVELPQRHGYPLRALIPGRFGEENAKWVTRVELTDHFVGGLYSDQGWYNGPLHTMNRIDRPRGRQPVGRPVEVGGFAFAGNRGIQKVEVSVDGGLNWHLATLEPPLSQDAWVFWTWQWIPTVAGQFTIEARATDGTGEAQTSHKQGTVPNGATGYHEIVVEVG
jgi:DMSO/TMAO reductase YedYZ molybdopterin-dependent catalytic subunit